MIIRSVLKPGNVTIIFITLINLYFLIDVRLCDYNGTNWKTVIYSDGKGYYEYLRSAFITKSFSNQDQKLGFVVKTNNERSVIKYFAGTAIAESPFFFIAYLQSDMANEKSDGYDYKFQLIIAIAGLVYCSVGLFFISCLLDLFYFREWIKVAVLIAITYGTNLFYYAILEPSMSHVYSFATIAVFLYAGRRYFQLFRIKYLLLSTVALGLTILIRPTNGVIVLMLPFLSHNYYSFKTFLSKSKHVVIAFLILAGCGFTQMLLWYLQCGQWYVWSYNGEGFYFNRPEIVNVLFSFRKGFFVYTPLALISLVGFVPLYRIDKKACISIAITILAVVYLTSCWWDWNYGDSFGMRPLVDFYPLFAILLASMFSLVRRTRHAILLTPVALILGLSILQTYQYYHHIIQHYSMDEEKYRYVFLKTGEQYQDVLAGNKDLMPFTKNAPKLLLDVKNEMEKPQDWWLASFTEEDSVYRGQKSCLFDENEVGLYFVIPASYLEGKADKLYVEATLRRYEFSEHSSSAALMEVSVEKKNYRLFDYEFRINDFPDEHAGQWRTFHYTFPVPVPDEQFDNVTIQIRNPAKQKFLIDDLEFKVYGLKY